MKVNPSLDSSLGNALAWEHTVHSSNPGNVVKIYYLSSFIRFGLLLKNLHLMLVPLYMGTTIHGTLSIYFLR